MTRLTGILAVVVTAAVTASALAAGPPQDPATRGQAAVRTADRARQALESRIDRRQISPASRRPALPDVGRGIAPAEIGRRSIGPQTGSGRLGRDAAAARELRGRFGRDMAEQARERIGSRRAAAGLRRLPSPRTRGEAGGEEIGRPDFGRPMAPRDRAERFSMDRSERLLAKRLAQIDHLRDIAMKNGNTRLLEQADELEALARRQHARRTGEMTERGGIGIGLFRTHPEPPTEPPTEPSVTEPPATEPPLEEPPLSSEPPLQEPPATEPPLEEPPATEPPSDGLPELEPPLTEEPLPSEPPASEPPADGGELPQ